MASTSAARRGGGASMRFKNATDAFVSDNRPLIADIRKALNTMREIAVEMERFNRSEEVRELEDAFVELLGTYEECMNFSNVMESVGNNYQPGLELTDFNKLFKNEVSRLKCNASSNRQTAAMLRQFKEAVWNVHHSGQPMPGEEQEDIVMTSTQIGISNTVCPISGKSITDLAEPVRSMDCKHVYDKSAILHFMKKNPTKKCPVAGCPKPLQANRVVCDTLLHVEIEELRSSNKNTVEPEGIEDFTALDDED
ncbi:E3 SUMO-protein ligase MMS21-like [Chenopodium quinoa]|uniref:SP-RING-type domain-containing protein n=1 Tax=Chenopodium quinoa TaxID=63459 RepID=A0A803LVI1_CHEQI|nr:E3 SUMO-protein ligase MMS21-like [Chenopodium quinoa]